MHICTDSKAVLQALSRVCINSQVVLQCARTLNRLGGRCQLHLNWVPGHIGISGNVAADRLARLGSRAGQRYKGFASGPSREIVKKSLANWVEGQHRRRWESAESGRQAKAALGSLLHPEWKTDFKKLKWFEARALVQVVTGHAPLNKHMFNVRLVKSPLCRWCKTEAEEAMHVLCECRALSAGRAAAFGDLPQEIEIIRTFTPKRILRLCRDIIPAKAGIF